MQEGEREDLIEMVQWVEVGEGSERGREMGSMLKALESDHTT